MLLLIAGLGAFDGGSAAAAPATSGASARLAKLSSDFWESQLQASPVMATSLGDRRYDDRLDDNTPAGIAKDQKRLEDFLAQARAIPPSELNSADQLTLVALTDELESDLAQTTAHLEEWNVDPVFGTQVELFNIESFQPVRSFAEGQAMVKRWRVMGPYIDQVVENWKRGLASGKVGSEYAVKKTISEVDETLALQDADWALLNPLKTPHPDWTEAQRAEFDRGLKAAVHESVRPALERFGTFLKTQDLPKARPQDKPGIMWVAGGKEAYPKLIKVHTSLTLSPDEIHEIGLKEVARINAEMVTLGQKVFGLNDLEAIHKKLRTDKSLYFATAHDVEAKAEST